MAATWSIYHQTSEKNAYIREGFVLVSAKCTIGLDMVLDGPTPQGKGGVCEESTSFITGSSARSISG